MKLGEHRSEPPEVRAVQAGSVDVRGRDHAHRDRGRSGEDGAIEALALGRLHLLRVVETCERTDAVTAQGCVVEQHPRDDEGPRERPTPRLVGSRDEPRTEPPVVPE